MNIKPIGEFSDEELVEASGATEIQKYGGAISQQAQAELTRRLMQTMREASEATDRYSKVALGFTLVLFVVSFMQLIVGIFGLGFELWIRAVAFVLAALIIIWTFRKAEKELW